MRVVASRYREMTGGHRVWPCVRRLCGLVRQVQPGNSLCVYCHHLRLADKTARRRWGSGWREFRAVLAGEAGMQHWHQQNADSFSRSHA